MDKQRKEIEDFEKILKKVIRITNNIKMNNIFSEELNAYLEREWYQSLFNFMFPIIFF